MLRRNGDWSLISASQFWGSERKGTKLVVPVSEPKGDSIFRVWR